MKAESAKVTQKEVKDPDQNLQISTDADTQQGTQKRKNGYQKFMDVIDKIVEALLIAMLIAVLVCVWLQVSGRYIKVVRPFPWTEEIARWLLVWLTFLGASHVAKTSSYTRVDFFVKKMSPKVQKVIGIIDKLFILCFSGWFAYKSFRVFTTVSTHERGPTTQLPMIIMRAAVFIGMGISFLQMLSSGGIHMIEPEEEEQSV
ncbi:MAG: TRAP transporter small permease [Clostridia bacterium]|nr:TRAP transporter small permease [Clostridia bacterium]